MKSKTIIFILWSVSGILTAQRSASLVASNADLEFSDIVSMDAGESGLGTTNRKPSLCFNMLNVNKDSAFGVISTFLENGGLDTALRFYIKDFKSYQFVKHVWSANNLFVFGNALSAVSSNAFVFSFNWSNRKVNWIKLIKPENANTSMTLIDAVISRNEIYLLSDVFVNIGPSGFSKPAVTKMDIAGNLIWTSEYENNLISQNENPEKIIISPDGKICFASVVYDLLMPTKSKIRLSLLNRNGELITNKLIRLYNADKSAELRPGNLFLRTNASNIHLVVQSVLGRSDAGPIAVTMFDTTLSLRTWRVYSSQIRVESFEIGRNTFILSGQRPVANGLEGFGLALINASNAIPESLLSFEYGFHNSSIATSSAADFIPSYDQHILFSKPNGESRSQMNVTLANETSSTHCYSKFEFSVTKDPIETEDTQDKMIFQQYKTESTALDYDLMSFEWNSICFPEATHDQHKLDNITWAITHNHTLQFQNLPDEQVVISIFDIKGNVLLNTTVSTNQTIDLSKFMGGFYTMCFRQGHSIKTAKFILAE